MSNNKKLFSTLSTLTVGVVAGSAIALSPVVAVAEHGEGKCKTEKHECKCEGTKKADCEKEHKGEGKCGGEKHDEHGEKGCNAKH